MVARSQSERMLSAMAVAPQVPAHTQQPDGCCVDAANKDGVSLRRTRSLMRPTVIRPPKGKNGPLLRRLSHEAIGERKAAAPAESTVFAQPLKVFRRLSVKNTWLKAGTSSSARTVSSCQALKNAVAKLYNVEDFFMHKIGEGFFSEVFKVVDKTSGRVMVLKKNKHRANRSTMLKEVQLMNTLSHNNILRYEAACVHEGQLHALTEYISGGSLEQLISCPGSNPSLPWSLRVALAVDIAKGMAYLHSRGFFHRDLTSKNILIRCDGPSRRVAVVADFGLATSIPKSQSQRLSQVGSPYWMSPECLKGTFYDEKADVFSYGIILCELIASIEADPDVLPRTANFGVDYIAFSQLVPDDCPPQFLKTAFSCVQIDPSSRPSFKELVNDLSALLGSLTEQEDKERISIPLSDNSPVDSSEASQESSDEPAVEVAPVVAPLASPPVAIPRSLRISTFSSPPLASSSPSPSLAHKELGQAMSLLDPHYMPSPAGTGANPFEHLPSRLRQAGKIVSHKDLFSSCFELPSPHVPRARRHRPPAVRKAVSLIHRDHVDNALASAAFCADIQTKLRISPQDPKDEDQHGLN